MPSARQTERAVLKRIRVVPVAREVWFLGVPFVLVEDAGRIINKPLEVVLICDRELTVVGIFAGKDCSRGVASPGRGVR